MCKGKIIWFVLLLGSLAFCGQKFISLYIGSQEFVAEVADTEEKRLRGLMFRESIPDDFGMLFVQEEEGARSIWMKNTLVHLDLIFLNKNKQVVDMYENVPPCKKEPCETYPSRKPAQYVLELRGGRAGELDLKIGDFIFFVLQ